MQLLDWFERKIHDLATDDQQQENLRRSQQSLRVANRKVQQGRGFKYGKLSPQNPNYTQARQQFVQRNRVPQYNPAKITQQAVRDTSIARFSSPAIGFGKDFTRGAYDIASIVPNEARSLVGFATGNKQAGINAYNQAGEGLDAAKQFAQAIPRQAVQLGESVNPFGGDVYKRQVTPTGLQKILVGDEPIPSMQKQYKETQKRAGTTEARGEALLNSLFSAGLIKGGAKPTVKAVKNREPLSNDVGAIGKNIKPEELNIGKALGMNKKQVLEAKYPTPKSNIGISKTVGLNTKVTKKLNEFGTEPITRPEPPMAMPIFDNNRFKSLTDAYLGKRQAVETLNTQAARQLPKLKEPESLKLISSIEKGASRGQFKGTPKNIRQTLDAKHKELTDSGVDIGYLKDYFPHKWQNEAQVIKDYQALKTRSNIQNTRQLPTLEEGMKLGFKPASKDYRHALQTYLNEADRLLASRHYFDQLQKNKLIVEAGSRPQGLTVVDAPGLPTPKPYRTADRIIQGNYYTTPELAANFNKLFGADVRGVGGKTLKKTSGMASTAQDIGMAGGLPGTSLNAFGIAQNLRHLMGGSVRAPLKADVLAFSNRLTNRYWDKHATTLAEIQSQGIPLRSGYSKSALKTFTERVNSALESGSSKTKATARFKEVWNSAVNKPTFERFMPIMQTEYYRHVRDNLVRAGVPKDQAIKIAGERLVNFEGMNKVSKQALRNKTGQDAITTFIFAPKYRESMINFWYRNVKALYPPNIGKALNPRNGAYRNNLIFDAASIGVFLYMDSLNQKNNDGRHLWENPPNKQDKLLVKLPNGKTVGIPFLSSIATMPRMAISAVGDVARGDKEALFKDVSSVLGYGVRPLADIVSNEDYFGNKVRNPTASIGEQVKQAAGYLATQYQHPYIRAGFRSQGKPGVQVASEALELPFRFYNTSGVNTALVQKDFGLSYSKASNVAKKKFDSFHPGANEFGDYEDLPDNPAFTRERATAYQDNELFKLEKAYAIAQNKFKGKPIDPVFNLPVQQRKKALWKQTMLPGSKDPELSNLYTKPWYQDFEIARSQYYDDKKKYNLKQADVYEKNGNKKLADKMRASYTSQDNPYPETPATLQKTMNDYSSLPNGTGARSGWIKANPYLWKSMTSQWAAIDNWQNKERVKLGLDATEGDKGVAGGYKQGYSGSGYRKYASRGGYSSRGGSGGSSYASSGGSTSATKTAKYVDTTPPKGIKVKKLSVSKAPAPKKIRVDKIKSSYLNRKLS